MSIRSPLSAGPCGIAARTVQPLAFAARALPDIFLRRRRTAGVLPWMRVTFARGAARRFFFFFFSMLRAERTAMISPFYVRQAAPFRLFPIFLQALRRCVEQILKASVRLGRQMHYAARSETRWVG